MGENDRKGCGKVDGKLPRNFRQSRGGSNPAYKIAFDDSEFAMNVMCNANAVNRMR